MYELQHLLILFVWNSIEGLWPVFGLMTYMNIYQRWSPLSLTLIYDTVALVESWLIMCAALLIYSSKLKALVQGFLSYFQKLNNEFPLLFCATRCFIAMLLSLSSALLQMNLLTPILWPFKEAPTLCWSWLQAFGFHYDPVFPSVIFSHTPSSCKFELLLIHYLCQVNTASYTWELDHHYSCPCSHFHFSLFPHRGSSQLLAGLQPTVAAVRVALNAVLVFSSHCGS